MNLQEHISNDLTISQHYVRILRTNKLAVCLVHKQWLRHLTVDKTLPNEFLKHETLSDLECGHILAQPSAVLSPWKLVSVHYIPKFNGLVGRFPKVQPQLKNISQQDLTYSQLLHYIAETNFKILWKEAHKKHGRGISQERRDEQHHKMQDYNDAVRESLHRVYNCPLIVASGNAYSDLGYTGKGLVHGNLLRAYCVVESSSAFYVVQPHLQHTLHDCLTFSPAIFGSSYCKPLFVVYQLLQALRDLHDRGLFVGDLSLHDVCLDQNLWVQIRPRLWDSLARELRIPELTKENKLEKAAKTSVPFCVSSSSHDTFYYMGENNKPPEVGVYLDILVEDWVRGDITNFDYLMELNFLAGRRLGNPNHHPVLPWVIDFTSPVSNWRDLSKSKYRLNKGDKQLDMTFETFPSAVADSMHVPHHTSDVLTDITYYVYMARRIPRSVLCQHVRPNWVPAEYPSSIQRMQEWTPDECIPEFYTDPLVVQSIHPDLPNLDLPWWANDPVDFITKHRAALESEYVSERLHNWIDLTFGFRLSGSAAVKSKNVCLHLVDQHTGLSNAGIVQLFQHPHPNKLAASPYLAKHPQKLHRLTLMKEGQKRDKSNEDGSDSNKENEEDSSLSEPSGRMFTRHKSFKSYRSQTSTDLRAETRTDTQPINLPKDYNPLAALNQLEALCNFTAKAVFKVSNKSDSSNSSTPHSLHQRKMRDMVSLGCLVVEIFLASRLRALGHSATLEERYELIVKILSTDFYELPRCVRHVVKLLLQLNIPTEERVQIADNVPLYALPQRYPAITNDGLPPPSAHQLLQPLVQLFPFPPYFQHLYSFLCQIKDYRDVISLLECMEMVEEEKRPMVTQLSDTLVKLTAKSLPKLMPTLTQEAIDIVVPYLQEMFDHSQTSVLAAWYLLDPVAQVLGPQQTKQRLLLALIRLYDSEAYTVKSLKLFHRSYLLQLIVRLGLQTFLMHFITRLIEAIGGYKDCLSDNSRRNSLTEAVRKSSHLHSPDLEVQDSFDIMLSPYDEDSSQAEPETLTLSNRSETKSDPEATDVEPETEPEVFVFEAVAEDLNAEPTDVDLMDQLEQKFMESSDSADAISISEGTIDGVRSPTLEEDSSARTENAESAVGSVPSSLPQTFGISISTSEGSLGSTHAVSVPNLASSFPVINTIDGDLQDNEVSLSKQSRLSPSCSPTILLSPPSKSEKTKSPVSTDYSISDVAMESINWLSHRLGPVLTAKYLSRNLLRMLGLCYYGKEQLAFVEREQADDSLSVSNKAVVGDENVSKVLECLASIAALYGEHFILLQYLTHAVDLVSSCKRRITANLEAGLIGSMMLMKHIIPYLSDTTLMDHLQDTVIRDILYPMVRLISSQRLSFPNGGHARQVIAYKLLDVLYLVGLRIGFEMTRKHLTAILYRFFASFDRVYSKSHLDVSTELKESANKSPEETYLIIQKADSGSDYTIGTPVSLSELKGSIGSLSPPRDVKEEKVASRPDTIEELCQLFTPEMAYTAYVPFCRLAGGIHMEQSLRNDELIRRLCVEYDEIHTKGLQADSVADDKEAMPVDTSAFSDASWHEDEHMVSGTFGKNVAMVGNRIDIQLEDESVAASEVPVISSPPSGEANKLIELPKCDLSKLVSKKMENNQRHLRGTWLAYWEHEIGRSDKDHRFNFKQIKLQSFTGHTNSVRAIHCLDNENSFISASKDKTVKLWSLRSHGDGTAHSSCQWTYPYHKKSVFGVTFLESLRLAGSCDSSVHLWDPFMGSCIKQFDSTKNSPITVLTAMPPPSPVLITGTTEATIRFLDARLLKYIHEYKVSIGPAGLIRCITVSPDGHWLAVGHSSGVISILDVRTGLMSGSWKGHEGEILQIKAFNTSSFVTSSLDHCVSVWNADDGKLQSYMRGPTEPVHCLSFYRNEMVSATTANRIGVHTSVDNQASFSSTRLRSDTFKGVITSLTVLPLNRLLLLGADNGMIRLLC